MAQEDVDLSKHSGRSSKMMSLTRIDHFNSTFSSKQWPDKRPRARQE